MPVALYPNVSQPTIRIMSWGGMLNGEIYYETYGKQLEEKLMGIPDVKEVNSTYRSRYRNWTVDFEWDVDTQDAKNLVANAVMSFENALPKNLQNLNVRSEGSRSSELLIAISSSSVDPKDLQNFVAQNIIPKISAIEGAGTVYYTSNEEKSLEVVVKYNKLLEYDIAPRDLTDKLSQKQAIVSLGSHSNKQTGVQKTYRLSTRGSSVEEIRNYPIKNLNGREIILGEIASVSLVNSPSRRIIKANGKRGLMISASPVADANISKFCSDTLSIINNSLATFKDVEVNTLKNPASFIDSAIRNIVISLVIGITIATIVILLFFKNLSSTFIIASSIPLSLASGISLISFWDVQLNLISLGAMALSVGMVVDGSIVVFENIMRKLETDGEKNKSETTFEKKIFLDICLTAAKEVTPPVVASILTTLVVFLPLSYTAPMAKAILGDLAAVITLVLASSILIATIYVPTITYLLYKNKNSDRSEKQYNKTFDSFISKLKSGYLITLEKIITNSQKSLATVTAVTLFCILGILILSYKIDREVLPVPSSDTIILDVSSKLGLTDPEILNQKIKPIEERLEKILEKDLKVYDTYISKHWIGFFIKINQNADIEEVESRLTQSFKNNLDFAFRIRKFNPTQLKIPAPAKMTINFDSEIDLESVEKILSKDLAHIENFSTYNSQSVEQDEYELEYKPRFRLLERSIQQNLKISIPAVISSINDKSDLREIVLDNETIPVNLIYSETTRPNFNPEDLGIKVAGEIVPIRNYIDFKKIKSPSEKSYKDNKVSNAILIDYDDRYSFEEIKTEISSLLPEHSNKMVFIDGMDEINENLSSLYIALAFAMAGILFIILVQFSSFKDAFIILSSIPMSIFGVASALFIFDETLSMNSLLGMILLAGIAVNNSIIFTDYFKKILINAKETPLSKIILNTAAVRFRPILITTLSTIIGMIPIAIGLGEGGDVLRSLGLTVVVGLGWSTLCTMVAVPLLLKYFYKTQTNVEKSGSTSC